MAMAQTVVPVYTIPNTYRVQQSLWESLCHIIPGVACTGGSELHSFEPVAPHNTPVGESDTALGGDPGTGIVGLGNPQNVTVSLPSCEKDVAQGTHLASLPDGIPPAGSHWAVFKQQIPTVNLADDGDPPDASPPETSTPIKATPESGKRHSKKKLNISKIEVTHLLFDMQDRQEKARRSVKSEKQVVIPDWTSDKERGFWQGAPTWTSQRHCLIGQEKTGCLPYPRTRLWRLPSGITSALMMMMTRSQKFLDEDKPAEPPKKKKKKKKK